MTLLAPILQSFFSERLQHQQQVSPHTILAYRDAFRLLLTYAEGQLGKAPSAILLEDINAPFVGAFLEHLEKERNNSARTRNARLAAIHSLFRYAAGREPAHADLIQRVLAIPQKRFARRLMPFLNCAETNALLAAPDKCTHLGRRDYTIMLLAVQTGLRLSELTALRVDDLELGAGAHLRCRGKGRKDRCTPLTKSTVRALRSWIAETRSAGADFLFRTKRRSRLSSDAVEGLVRKYAGLAKASCPTLARKNITPHVLRHTAAMRLLEAGVDRSVIALWLGHEHLETTQIYVHADLTVKERALARMVTPAARVKRYKPPDELIAFLQNL